MIALFIGSDVTLNDVILSSFILFIYLFLIIYNSVSLTSNNNIGVIQNFIYFFPNLAFVEWLVVTGHVRLRIRV